MGKTKKMTMMKALLLTAIIPTFIAAAVIAYIGVTSLVGSLSDDVYHELYVAAEGLEKYYIDEVSTQENHTPEYDHKYVDALIDNDIQLTLFLQDVRYITSIKDSNNESGRNEGTTASPEIWAEVSAGNKYSARGVAIEGEEYYVCYVPLIGEDGTVYGMAFAGKQESIVKAEIGDAVKKIVLLAFIILLICSGVVVFIAKKIKEPLSIIDRNLQLLADGELQPWKTAKSSIAEIDSIIQSRKKLSEALQQIVAKVQSASSDLLQNGDNLKDVAESTSINAEGITNTVSEISKGAISMAGDIETANVKVSDMGYKIEGIVEGISDLDNVANEMDEAGQKAMDIIKILDSSNAKTVEAIQIVADNVEATDHSVAQISTAVDMITSIASQTNLLALNASIEAARAGEAGKGFAVVANEISTLADQSNQSAKQIEDTLSHLVTDSKRSMEKMQEVMVHLQETQEDLKKTQVEFANVNSGIQDTRGQSEKVDIQAKDCDEYRSIVIEIISNLSALSEENAANTQETTDSIEELADTIKMVAQQAVEVQNQAKVLEEAMTFFKL